jgi:hypothetical protein
MGNIFKIKKAAVMGSVWCIMILCSCSKKPIDMVLSDGESKVSVYQPCLRDRLFDGSTDGPQYAEAIRYKIPDNSFRILQRYNKTVEVNYSLYILRDSTVSGEMVRHSYIISKKPIASPELLALCPLNTFDVYLYEGGEFQPAQSLGLFVASCKLVAYYQDKKYEWGSSCLRIMPAYDPYPTPKPAPKCLDWYWADKDEKGNVLNKRFLFKSCDIISWESDPNISVKPIDN